MALPKELPPDWIGIPVDVSVGMPIQKRDGALEFSCFSATVLRDFPEMVELETESKIRLYPKNAIAYLSRPKVHGGDGKSRIQVADVIIR